MTNNPYDFPENLHEFAFTPHFSDNIDALTSLAESENWDYQQGSANHKHPILVNYVKHTFARLAEEKKIEVSADSSNACWNTGLITSSQEPLFALYNVNNLDGTKQYWHFWKFARQGQHELSKFDNLPEIAHYFDDPSLLVYDTRKELRVNVEHVIADNKDRFPSELQSMNEFGLRNIVSGAIDAAKSRVARNYKTAIPQFYRGNIQLLLPLSLTDPAKADLALVIERHPNFYRASTCLTLDMAYNNARQLARPDRDWLAP